MPQSLGTPDRPRIRLSLGVRVTGFLLVLSHVRSVDVDRESREETTEIESVGNLVQIVNPCDKSRGCQESEWR